MPFDHLGSEPAAARRRRRGRMAGAVGRGGEEAASRRYRADGWREVARNWRPGRGHGGGEIDLIMRRGGLVAFVEVKSRGAIEAAAGAVRPAQRRRLVAAALRFMEVEEALHLDMRFDLVCLDRHGRLEVIENAFFD